jgi:hypothetical protein
MSKWKDVFFKQETGQTFKEWTRVPKASDTIRAILEQENSNYLLRSLGDSEAGLVFLPEELRAAHIHILGTTREGKSKFLELLIRHDIDNGFGCTLLDPSDNGQTAYNILKYCIKQGFTKVCLIDPHDHHTAVPTINPLRWRGSGAVDSVVSNLMDSVRLLWGQTSFAETPRIENYLYAIFAALYATGNPKLQKPFNCGIPDAIHFSARENKYLEYCRRRILDCLHPANEARVQLEEVFTTRALFLNEFKSSIRRLSPFFKYLPRLMYGSSESPLDIRQMIADKWVVLVNLDKKRLWGTPQQRLLGTLMVNELVSAVADLTENGWKGQHYLYIDEAGQFATRVLADIMAYQGKSGLWATVSHQFYNQFEDKYVLDAVENLCKIKILFYTPNATDRNRMVRDMYVGDLKDQAGDAHASLKKQHAVIKIGKEPPATIRIADVPDIDISPTQLGEFKERYIYKANPWYRTAESIQEEIKHRFAVRTTSAGTAPKERQSAQGNLKPKGTTGEPSAKPSSGEDKAKPKRKSVFDNLPDS